MTTRAFPPPPRPYALLHLCSGGVSNASADWKHAPKEPKGPTDKNGNAMNIMDGGAAAAAAAAAAAEEVAAAELALGNAKPAPAEDRSKVVVPPRDSVHPERAKTVFDYMVWFDKYRSPCLI